MAYGSSRRVAGGAIGRAPLVACADRRRISAQQRISDPIATSASSHAATKRSAVAPSSLQAAEARQPHPNANVPRSVGRQKGVVVAASLESSASATDAPAGASCKADPHTCAQSSQTSHDRGANQESPLPGAVRRSGWVHRHSHCTTPGEERTRKLGSTGRAPQRVVPRDTTPGLVATTRPSPCVEAMCPVHRERLGLDRCPARGR